MSPPEQEMIKKDMVIDDDFYQTNNVDRGCYGGRSWRPQIWFPHAGVRAPGARGLGEHLRMNEMHGWIGRC
jgi:hypothetical protein